MGRQRVSVIVTVGHGSFWRRLIRTFQPKAQQVTFTLEITDNILSIKELEAESAKLVPSYKEMKIFEF